MINNELKNKKNKSNTFFNTIINNIFILLIYLLCGFIQLCADLINNNLNITCIIYIFLSISIIIYFYIHISYTRQKVCLIFISSLMLLFMVFKVLKYGGFSQIDILARHLWYLYYLPILFIPSFLLLTSLSNYYETHKKLVLISAIISFMFSLILSIIVLLNDFHQLVFKFNDDFKDWDIDYSHNFVYYIVFIYVTLLLISSFVILFRQCQIAKGKRYSYVSLIPLILGFIYMVLYIFNLIPKYKGYSIICEFPETLCFMIVSFIFSLISLNIIATNRNYKDFFLNMSLPAYINDINGNIIYQNENSKIILNDKEENKSNYLCQTSNIYGGNVTWISDVSDLNQIYQELRELNDRLKEEKQLNLLISNLKEEQLIILEKDKLYDEIAKEVLDESSKIIELSRIIKNDMTLFDKYMPIILILCIYIKRFANIKLLKAEKEYIDLNELYLSINELLRYLEKNGIKTAIVGKLEGEYNSDKLLNTYIFISKTIINNLDKIIGVSIIFTKDYLLKINIEGKNLIINDKDNININIEDDIYYISINREDII